MIKKFFLVLGVVIFTLVACGSDLTDRERYDDEAEKIYIQATNAIKKHIQKKAPNSKNITTATAFFDNDLMFFMASYEINGSKQPTECVSVNQISLVVRNVDIIKCSGF